METNGVASKISIRRACVRDNLSIMQLYFEIYGGNYPDPTVSRMTLLNEALSAQDIFWIVAEFADKIVGSVIYKLDEKNRLAKVYGAVIEEKYRGHHLTQRMMTHGYNILISLTQPVDVVYATTRTVTKAPQKLTASLGYKKIGICPNVHKTEQFETHGLTALLTKEAIATRFTDFSLHPEIMPLYEIVRHEFGLAPLPEDRSTWKTKIESTTKSPALEAIQAAEFVRHRFLSEISEFKEHHWFFPFQDPNILLTSPDQKNEIFAYMLEADKHCVLIGIRDMDNIGYEALLNHSCHILRRMGTRYIEFIMRADETEKIQTALDAKFVPSAYFPALQLISGLRYDFVTFSRSFEILDFSNVKLEGVNRELLEQYINSWKKLAMDPAFKVLQEN